MVASEVALRSLRIPQAARIAGKSNGGSGAKQMGRVECSAG